MKRLAWYQDWPKQSQWNVVLSCQETSICLGFPNSVINVVVVNVMTKPLLCMQKKSESDSFKVAKNPLMIIQCNSPRKPFHISIVRVWIVYMYYVEQALYGETMPLCFGFWSESSTHQTKLDSSSFIFLTNQNASANTFNVAWYIDTCLGLVLCHRTQLKMP